jgi:hypothetical protein
LIYDTSEFVFQPPAPVARARRILIKPCAGSAAPYPQSTSPALLETIIAGIRQVSDADILLLEGTTDGSPVQPVYRALGYEFPRVLSLDVKDCTWVEVDNPLEKPYAVTTFWIPNVILSSDYLISVAPLTVTGGRARMSIANLLSVLPREKYGSDYETLTNLGVDRVIADLYFTLPFDMGIIEADCIYSCREDGSQGVTEDCGNTFIGDPYQVDSEASRLLDLPAHYLELIASAKEEFDF